MTAMTQRLSRTVPAAPRPPAAVHAPSRSPRRCSPPARSTSSPAPPGVDFRLADPRQGGGAPARPPGNRALHPGVRPARLGSLAALERLTRRAAAVWTAPAAAVLLLSFVPIALERATGATRVLLVVIHVAVAAVIVPVFRFTRR